MKSISREEKKTARRERAAARSSGIASDKSSVSEAAAISRAEKLKARDARRAEKLRMEAEKTREREKRIAAEEQAAEEKRKLAEIKRSVRQKRLNKLKFKLKNDPSGFDYRGGVFAPRVELSCRGDGASIASLFTSSQIDMYDFSRDGAFVRFKLRKKDLRKAIAILDKMCYTYQISGGYGIGKLGAFLLSRIGLMLGAAASAVCLNISYGYIWRVDISGNENLSAAAIESVLKANGVGIGVKKSDEVATNVAAAVSGMDGVVDATTEIIGTTLHVYVLESDEYTAHESYGAYESCFDATVTRIVVRSGSALVKRGDVVKCGDVLADGGVYSTAGELMYVGDCDADIYGDVSVTFTAEVSDTVIEYRRTGRSAKKTQFDLFGLKIFKATSPFAMYESVSTTSNYDILLPLYVTTHEYFEIEPIQTERNIDEIAKEFARAKSEEMKFTGDFTTSYNIKPSVSGLYSIHLFLSGEALISKGIVDYVHDTPSEKGDA